jgi:N-acetylmuramoyl-L-alanine amidase
MSLTKFILFIFIFSSASTAQTSQKSFTIMIEPAGDAKHAGRAIDDCFERGITLQFAERIKKLVEAEYPHIRVILSRFAGESLEHLQNANFANRLNVGLYLSIHFFVETEEKPVLHLYHFVYNQITDYWSGNDSLEFIPYDKAHQKNIVQTKKYADLFYEALKIFNKQFEARKPIGFPFKPLIGIQAPALAFEASLKTKDDWLLYLNPIAHGIKAIVDQ